MTLWTLQKNVYRLQAELEFAELAHSYELVFLWNGQVLNRQLWPREDAEEVIAFAEATRVDLEGRGWTRA